MAHSRETEHYQLPLYNGTDIINPLTDFNNANEKIDETMYNVAQIAASAEQSAQQSAGVVHDYDERVTEAESTAQNAGIKADNTMNMIAEEFNPLKEGGYAIGDMVIYNQHLYSFINPHTGAWDASDVKEQPIGEALEDTIAQAKVEIQRALTEAIATIAAQMVRVDNTQKMIGEPFDAEKDGGYEKGDIVTYADRLWMFSEDHSGVWTGADVEQVDVIELLENVNTDLYSITDDINERVDNISVLNSDEKVVGVAPTGETLYAKTFYDDDAYIESVTSIGSISGLKEVFEIKELFKHRATQGDASPFAYSTYNFIDTEKIRCFVTSAGNVYISAGDSSVTRVLGYCITILYTKS